MIGRTDFCQFSSDGVDMKSLVMSGYPAFLKSFIFAFFLHNRRVATLKKLKIHAWLT